MPTSTYKISNNLGQKKKKNPKAKSKIKLQRPIVRYNWSVIENMTLEELDNYLTNTFKINH